MKQLRKNNWTKLYLVLNISGGELILKSTAIRIDITGIVHQYHFAFCTVGALTGKRKVIKKVII